LISLTAGWTSLSRGSFDKAPVITNVFPSSLPPGEPFAARAIVGFTPEVAIGWYERLAGSILVRILRRPLCRVMPGVVGSFTEGARVGWGTLALGLMAVGLASLCALVFYERRVANPLLDPAVLRRPRVRAGLVTATLVYLSFFGALVATPFYVEALGHSAEVAGLVTMALPLGLALIAPFSGFLRRRASEHVVVPVAFLAVAGGLALASRSSDLGVLAASLFFAGLGLGVANTLNNASVMTDVPAMDRGTASALVNMVRALGTALGLALVTTLLAAFAGPGHTIAARDTISALVIVPLVTAGTTAVLLRSAKRTSPVRSGSRDSA